MKISNGVKISYTSLDTYQSCPLKYKFREVDKIPEVKSKDAVFGNVVHGTLKFIHTPGVLYPTLDQAMEYFSNSWNPAVFEDENEERAAFSQGIRIIQDYYRENNPADFKVVDLESRFQIEIGSEDNRHTVAGIIDRIDKTDEGYEIIDYKTNKKMPSQEKVDNDLQLSVYLKAFLKRYPKEIESLDKIKVSLYFLRHGVKLTSNRTLEQLEKSEQLFLEVIKLIESEKFEPNVSPLCSWCSYQKICPMWSHKFKEVRKFDSQKIQEIIEEYLNLKSAMNISRTKIAKLQGEIGLYMDQEGVERVFGESGIIERAMRKSYEYDLDKVREILEPIGKWEEIVKVDGTALGRMLLALSPEIKARLEKARKVKETKSFVVKKAVVG